MDQRRFDNRLGQQTHHRSLLDLHSICSGLFILLIVVSKDGINIQGPGGPFAILEDARLERHLGKAQ